jgi:hypothetical protein
VRVWTDASRLCSPPPAELPVRFKHASFTILVLHIAVASGMVCSLLYAQAWHLGTAELAGVSLAMEFAHSLCTAVWHVP